MVDDHGELMIEWWLYMVVIYGGYMVVNSGYMVVIYDGLWWVMV